MDRTVKTDEITLLMDTYSTDSQKLHDSLKIAGYNVKAVAIEDDGFLPEDVISLFQSFLGDYGQAALKNNSEVWLKSKLTDNSVPGRPRYFNQIQIPEYWEISGNNSNAKINDKYIEKAKIYYAEPTHKRNVKVVDWMDLHGVVRCSDHYNRYGALYAKTIFNAKGQKVSKSYYSVDRKEVIVENFVTKDIILNEDGEIKLFHNKTEFVVHFLKKNGLDKNRIFFTSLSVPFFATLHIDARDERDDIMFWQENTGKDIPGNMQSILNGNAKRCNTILVQKKESYDRLMELGASPEKVKYLGYIYQISRMNKNRPNALICTNSDRILQLETLVTSLPEMHFNIAALTEMSSKLMSIENYDNVTLYPGIKAEMQKVLFADCDYYFDINTGAEIISAVHSSFVNDMLIIGFNNVAHNKNYVSPNHLFEEIETDKMIELVKSTLLDREKLDQELAMQYDSARFETKERYWKMI